MNKKQHLLISSILFAVVLVLWPVFMAIAMPEGDIAAQFEWILQHKILHKLQFLFAFLIAPTLIYMMLMQLELCPPITRWAFRMGYILLGAYLVLISIAYGSQLIVLPALVETGKMEIATFWYMGNSSSVIYFMNQMGYLFWSGAAIVWFLPLLRTGGLIRYLGVSYMISAILSVLAFIGLIIESPKMNALTMPSGLVLIAVVVLSLVWSLTKDDRNTN